MIAVHLYGGSTAKLDVGGRHGHAPADRRLSLVGQDQDRGRPGGAGDFALKLRIPGWAQGETLQLNGKPLDDVAKRARLCRDPPALERRATRSSSTCRCRSSASTPIPTCAWTSGGVALKRGPLVYCVEQADNAGAVPRLKIGAGATPVAAERPDLLDGIVTVVADGALATAGDWDGSLYRTAPVGHEPAKLTAIPYYLWANREPGPMRVWISQVSDGRAGSSRAPGRHAADSCACGNGDSLYKGRVPVWLPAARAGSFGRGHAGAPPVG